MKFNVSEQVDSQGIMPNYYIYSLSAGHILYDHTIATLTPSDCSPSDESGCKRYKNKNKISHLDFPKSHVYNYSRYSQ